MEKYCLSIQNVERVMTFALQLCLLSVLVGGAHAVHTATDGEGPNAEKWSLVEETSTGACLNVEKCHVCCAAWIKTDAGKDKMTKAQCNSGCNGNADNWPISIAKGCCTAGKL